MSVLIFKEVKFNIRLLKHSKSRTIPKVNIQKYFVVLRFAELNNSIRNPTSQCLKWTRFSELQLSWNSENK